MLLLTNCEVHTGKYLDRSFEVRTERSELRGFVGLLREFVSLNVGLKLRNTETHIIQ